MRRMTDRLAVPTFEDSMLPGQYEPLPHKPALALLAEKPLQAKSSIDDINGECDSHTLGCDSRESSA